MTIRIPPPCLQANKTWANGIAGVRKQAPEGETSQETQISDSSTSSKPSVTPMFSPTVTPKFVELPFRLPETASEETRWNWNSVGFVHEVRTFVLFVNAQIRIGLKNGQSVEPVEWKVGFVQNVLNDTLTYKYKDSDEQTIVLGEVLLDQEPPFDEPWLDKKQHPIEGLTLFDTFKTGAGEAFINLAMNDVPFKGYNNDRQGNRELGQLEYVSNEMTFGLWILARPVKSPAQELSSYTIVSAHDWSLQDKLTVISQPHRPYHIALPVVELANPKYSFKEMNPVKQPVLSGVTANKYQWKAAREIIY